MPKITTFSCSRELASRCCIGSVVFKCGDVLFIKKEIGSRFSWLEAKGWLGVFNIKERDKISSKRHFILVCRAYIFIITASVNWRFKGLLFKIRIFMNAPHNSLNTGYPLVNLEPGYSGQLTQRQVIGEFTSLRGEKMLKLATKSEIFSEKLLPYSEWLCYYC